jgi:hypothetical protein
MVTSSSKGRLLLGATAVALLFTARSAHAQQALGARVVPTHNVVLSGYGTVGYAFRPEGENQNEFTASVSPVFLYQFQDKVLFEAEFEFELTGGVTETGLEYAQIDVLLSDNVTLVGGKFLLPFGVFGERLHPTWINKFPTAPPLYGHHVSEFGAEPIIPVLSDVGVMLRGAVTPGPWHLGVTGYATNGPAGEVSAPGDVAELEIPASSSDNNTDKLFGGRIDIALPPWAEVNISYLNGDYDEQNVLDFTGWNVAAELRRASVELRGEYIQTRQEVETLTGFEVLKRHGYYAQLAYRWRAWEPIVRWTQVFDTELDGVVQDEGAWQAAVALDYWFSPSIAVMGAYELNREQGTEIDNDRAVIHIAFGF